MESRLHQASFVVESPCPLHPGAQEQIVRIFLGLEKKYAAVRAFLSGAGAAQDLVDACSIVRVSLFAGALMEEGVQKPSFNVLLQGPEDEVTAALNEARETVHAAVATWTGYRSVLGY